MINNLIKVQITTVTLEQKSTSENDSLTENITHKHAGYVKCSQIPALNYLNALNLMSSLLLIPHSHQQNMFS